MFWIILSRFLAYLILAYLFNFVAPYFFGTFKLGFFSLGCFFVVAAAVVIVRLIYGPETAALWSDYVLTPSLWLAVAGVACNLWYVSRLGPDGKLPPAPSKLGE